MTQSSYDPIRTGRLNVDDLRERFFQRKEQSTDADAKRITKEKFFSR